MNKANVIKVRDTFKNAGVKIQIFGDNSNVYDERYDVLIWDDENELLFVIQRVKTQSVFEYSDPNNAAFYSVLEYEIIQYIQAVSDFYKFKEVLPEFGNVDAERKEKIIDWVAETSGMRINVKPGTDAKLDLAKNQPAKFDAVYGKGAAVKYLNDHGVEIPNVVFNTSMNKTLQAVIEDTSELQDIELGCGVTECITVPADKKVTINLCGNDLNITEDLGLTVLGELVIKDKTGTGKITSNKTPINVEGPNAKVIIESGKIESTETYAIYTKNGGTVVINGGEIISKDSPLTGNNTTGSMNFEINGGTLTAERGPAIYMPGQGKLTITDGTLNGGISLRMGQVNISGGTFNAITENIDSPKDYYHYSGNAWFPDALYVFGGTYSNGDEKFGNSLNINITGGKFNCQNGQGSAVAIYDLGKVAQDINVNISGAELITNATDRNPYDVLTLDDIGVTNPKNGFNNPEYVGKVVSNVTV